MSGCVGADEETPLSAFDAVQADLFSLPGAQPLAWADFDQDGDLDLFAGYRGQPNRLYRNDAGIFVDVAPELGLADPEETRAAAWGDFDLDGDLDLYVGFRLDEDTPNRLYRNEGPGEPFRNVAPELGLGLLGNTRQTSWLDYDGDGDLDLFVAFREQANRLFRNELRAGSEPGDATQASPSFTDVTEASGLGDTRRTVGVAWFDMEGDGDLDVFVANQNGDADGFYRNEAGVFTDVAPELGMDSPDRTDEYGGVGPAVVDFDNDGDLDLFVANYGPDVLWRNDGRGRFVQVSAGTPLGDDYHSTSAAWGDMDHDGWPDLFVVSYLSGVAEVDDHLFRNLGGMFVDVTPQRLQRPGASHGVAWADFDMDGDLDLALANNHPDGGGTPLFRNRLEPQDAQRALQVAVVDRDGLWRFPGAEVRVYEAGGDRVLGTRLLDVGGGYCSQGAAPVHFGVPVGVSEVDVEVTVPSGGRRIEHKVEGVAVPVVPFAVLEIRIPEGE
jgi:hypothetical protein